MSHPVSARDIPRALYLRVFGVLTLLTVAEIAVVYVPGIARGLLILALMLLAVAKAALVLLYFMHLRDESRGLRLTVLVPFALPAAVRRGADGRGGLARFVGGAAVTGRAPAAGAGRWRGGRAGRTLAPAAGPGLPLLRRAGRARAGRAAGRGRR